MRVGTIVAVGAVLIIACGDGAEPDPVELAERHVASLNEGDLEGFLGAFAPATVVMGIGTADQPEVAEAAAFTIGSHQGAEGFVATCAPWGTEGAKCEGPVYDRVTSPAGLWRDLTLTYRFNDGGEIVHFGEMVVYDRAEFDRYSSSLTAWVQANHPEVAAEVTEYGHLKKTGADVIEMMIPLAEEFIAESDKWPLPQQSDAES